MSQYPADYYRERVRIDDAKRSIRSAARLHLQDVRRKLRVLERYESDLCARATDGQLQLDGVAGVQASPEVESILADA